MKNSVSAIVLTRNEEKNLTRCLEHLQWLDEIIIVDDYSNDKTVAIAESFGYKVFQRRLSDSFALQRNFGLQKANGEWVLFIDADEVVSQELKNEILQKLETVHDDIQGFLVKREDFLFGKKLRFGDVGNVKLLRFARKNAGIWIGKVHEVWDVKGRVDYLRYPLLHFPHPTMRQFLMEINWYSTVRAKELFALGKKSSFVSIVAYTKAKFLYLYFFKFGFLDGVAGMIHALMMSFYSFLTRAKLYLLWQNKKDG